eukprot:TRINITY_DN2356_c0_g1_i11.p4 TRINITY_DN2356_c0_g1~~TRINITY_DN2356_c0_g1_i11.p4  ORF type:complete len:105 (+),score=16.27 TRINITY_DN2356_c0_g1_i11:1-315(+)
MPGNTVQYAVRDDNETNPTNTTNVPSLYAVSALESQDQSVGRYTEQNVTPGKSQKGSFQPTWTRVTSASADLGRQIELARIESQESRTWHGGQNYQTERFDDHT